MYPFMTLSDGTEIVHSETLDDGRVKVYMEKPDAKDGFHHVTCYLPDYAWEDAYGFSDEELAHLQDVVSSTANLILEFAADGGSSMPQVLGLAPTGSISGQTRAIRSNPCTSMLPGARRQPMRPRCG